MSEGQIKMISIWLMVAIAMGVYGFIILGMGVYYISHPEADLSQAPASVKALNPSLWWGAAMVFFAGLLVLVDRLAARREKVGKKV